jgi:hypothetical protein
MQSTGLMMRLRLIWWLSLISVILCGQNARLNNAFARDPFVREQLASLARPSETTDDSRVNFTDIERLLFRPVNGSGGPDRHVRRAPAAVWPSQSGLIAGERQGGGIGSPRAKTVLYPGVTLTRLNTPLTRLASLDASAIGADGGAAAMLDALPFLGSTGNLVGDPAGLYSHFLIEVDRSRHTLSLFGFRQGQKKVIYSTRVGLGSAEFPTPKGSFYICRIFDEKPLWIPPPDRWWAWGMAPSHSVYGGHMMPFFTKRPAGKASWADDDLDKVAPRVDLVDAGMYRIHGTDSPWSVGDNQSHGCVRMLNSTVAALANNLKMYVGMANRGRSDNGPFVNLARPVRLVLR